MMDLESYRESCNTTGCNCNCTSCEDWKEVAFWSPDEMKTKILEFRIRTGAGEKFFKSLRMKLVLVTLELWMGYTE